MHHTSDQWDSTASLLAATHPPAGREAVWARVLTYLDAGECEGAHLLASVVVVDAGGSVLLARHRRYGQWGPLGGHVDPSDTSLRAAATRELFEESGLTARVDPAPIDVRLSSYPCRTAVEPVVHLDVQFVALATGCAPAVVASNELTGLEWFGARNLAPLTAAAVELVGLAGTAAALRR